MGAISTNTKPIILSILSQALILTIPRIVCGYLLSVEFKSPKFGLPWSNTDYGLELFEGAFWFLIDLAKYDGIFAIFPVFFAWMGAFSEGFGGILLALGIQIRIASFLILCAMVVPIFYAINTKRIKKLPSRNGFPMDWGILYDFEIRTIWNRLFTN